MRCIVEQMTVTAKIQISATTDDKVLLDETMSVYSDACNYVSDYVFRSHDLNRTNRLLLRLTLVIRVNAVLCVDILKSLTVIRGCICLPARTVAISLTMTALEL